MKKLLILAYDFPPYVSVGGLRPYSWYKYFKDFGLYPIVVTRQWGNKYGNHLDYVASGESNDTIIEETEFGTIIRTPYKPNLSNQLLLKYGEHKFRLIRKMITGYYEYIQFMFFVGPKSGIYHGAKKYLKKQDVDFIIATGEPFVLFKYASKLSQKFKIPWIADYRDPWIQNNSRSANKIRKKFYLKFERKFTNKAKCISTVSDTFAKLIHTNISNRKISIIMNGFDPEAIEQVKEIKQNDKILSFAFAGTIYNYHPVYSVLQQFSIFIKNYPDSKIKINFYGINKDHLIETLVKKHFQNLIDIVHIYQKMPNEQLLQKLATNNIMLLFNYYSTLGTKIFDYAALKRQIVLCYSDDDDAIELKRLYFPTKELNGVCDNLQEEFIKETSSGIVIKDSEHLQETLKALYQEFISNLKISCNSRGFEKYSRKEQTKILANLIKENY